MLESAGRRTVAELSLLRLTWPRITSHRRQEPLQNIIFSSQWPIDLYFTCVIRWGVLSSLDGEYLFLREDILGQCLPKKCKLYPASDALLAIMVAL